MSWNELNFTPGQSYLELAAHFSCTLTDSSLLKSCTDASANWFCNTRLYSALTVCHAIQPNFTQYSHGQNADVSFRFIEPNDPSMGTNLLGTRSALPEPAENPERPNIMATVTKLIKDGGLAKFISSGNFPATMNEPFTEHHRRCQMSEFFPVLDKVMTFHSTLKKHNNQTHGLHITSKHCKCHVFLAYKMQVLPILIWKPICAPSLCKLEHTVYEYSASYNKLHTGIRLPCMEVDEQNWPKWCHRT